MTTDDEALTANQLAAIAGEAEGAEGAEGGEGSEGAEGAEGAEGGEGAAAEGGEAKPTEIEELAAETGWTPKETWRGNPDDWVDARTFLRQGPAILRTTLKRQDGQLSEMRDTMVEFRDHHRKVDQRAYDRALADLKAEQRAAVEEGDTEAFDDAEEKIAALGKEAPEPEKKPAKDDAASAGEDPNFKPFVAENSWYGGDALGDAEMTAFAESISKQIGRHHQGQAFYDKIGEEVRAKFPDRFKNPSRREPSRVEGSTGRGGRPGGGNSQSYDNLPPEAKAACNRFVKQGLLKREEYLRDYDWG